MTIADLSKLSDEKLNVRLAELRGYTFHDVKLHKGEAVYEKFWLRPGVKLEDITADDICWREGTSVPSYCSDLNAVAAVEAGLTVEQRVSYVNNLLAVTEDADLSRITFASARQRTIALIATPDTMTNSPNEPTPELLPCPFCGRQPEVKVFEHRNLNSFWETAAIRCWCGWEAHGGSIDSAAKLWNTRADSRAIAAEKERDELREDKAILDWLEKMLKQSPKHWGLVHINTLPEHAQVGACNEHHGLEAGSIIAPTLREAARTAIRAARKDHE